MHTIEQRNTQETISLRVTMSCTQKMMVTVCKLQCAHGHYSHTLDGAPRAAHHPCCCAPQLHCLSQRVTPTSPPHGAQYHTATGCQCTVEASNLLIVCSAEFAQPAMLPRQCTPHQPVQQCHGVPSSSSIFQHPIDTGLHSVVNGTPPNKVEGACYHNNRQCPWSPCS